MAGEQPHTHRTARVVALSALLLLVAAGWWFATRRDRERAPAQPTAGSPPAPGSAGTSLSRPPQAMLEETLSALLARAGNRSSPQILSEARLALSQLPPEQASRILRAFLATGNDAPTGTEFKVGADGFLTGAPTLRTFLLDQLGQIDPAGAAAFARQLLETMRSPDEWALALRNLARHDLSEDGRRVAARKLQEMLTHEPWSRDASVGFLEAFDVAVHLRDTSLIPTLTDLVRRKENPGAAHAAYLALDRLTIAEPAATLAALQAKPDGMNGRELTRANYFARADVREDAQRKILEDYLLRPALTAEELGAFAGLYPNANFMVSHNLLTKTQTPDHAWIVDRDRAALRQVRAWMQDDRFGRLKPQLGEIEQRLKQFVERNAGAP